MNRIVPPYIPKHVKPQILIVGQAPADDELILGRPFVGNSGRELDRMCRLAGLVRGDCAITNVFDQQIPENNIETILVEAKEARAKIKAGEWGDYSFPPIKRGWFLHPDWTHHLPRLAGEIAEVNPNLILAMGDEALWATTGLFGISSRRGAVTTAGAPWMPTRGGAEYHDLPGADYKVLPTFHPAYVIRNYKARIPVISDMMKAIREARTPHLEPTPRELWLEPTLDDIRRFKREYLDNAEVISVDIETAKGQITAIAFAPTRDRALCVPFSDWTCAYSHWPTLDEELEAWKLVKEICENPAQKKLLQNGSYDAQWLWEKRRIKLINYSEDTRLLHHALYPELPKSLEFLGSVYENEGAWKQMRSRKTEKRDE